jgi:hypothetical protein
MTTTASAQIAQLRPREQLRELFYIANIVDPVATEAVELAAIATLRSTLLCETAWDSSPVAAIVARLAAEDAKWEAERESMS